MRKTILATHDTASLAYAGKNHDVSVVIVDNDFVVDAYTKFTVCIDGVQYSMLQYASGKTVFLRNELGRVSYANHKYDVGVINALETLI